MSNEEASEKVRKLAVVATQPGAPNERIIMHLREALKDAKAGRLQGIGLAMAVSDAGPDGDGGRCTESIICFTEGWLHSVTAAVSALDWRIHGERYDRGHAIPDPKLTEEDE